LLTRTLLNVRFQEKPVLALIVGSGSGGVDHKTKNLPIPSGRFY
jgi:hypothetical protein